MAQFWSLDGLFDRPKEEHPCLSQPITPHRMKLINWYISCSYPYLAREIPSNRLLSTERFSIEHPNLSLVLYGSPEIKKSFDRK